MSGRHDDISFLASKCFPDHSQSCARDMIDVVIRNQVVTVPGVQKHWRVQVGTGMGLRCSGELSDCTFFKLAEENFAVRADIQQRYSILFYCRFKDDGFFIIDAPRLQCLEFCEFLRRKSSYFRIVFDSVSLREATMLDTTFFKGPGWMKTGRLDYRLHVKDTRQWRPLMPSSAHPRMVHETWPVAEATRIAKRFSSFKIGKKTAHEFLQSLHNVGIDTGTHHPKVSRSHFDHRPVLPRLILPYCVEWASARLSQILGKVFRAHSSVLCGFLPSGPPVQISWKLSGRHLVQKLRSFNTNV